MKIWNRQEDEVRLDAIAPQALGRLVPGRRKLRPPSPSSVLHAGELLYRGLFDEAPIGLYITTADGTIINANAELARMLGYPSKQMLLGASVAGIYADPQDRQSIIDALGQLDAAHRSEVELRTRSGAIILALDTCCVVRDERGTPLYYQGCMQDITEAKRLEEQLRQMARHDPPDRRLQSPRVGRDSRGRGDSIEALRPSDRDADG